MQNSLPQNVSLRRARIRRLAETSVALALATALSLVVIYRFPQGGSVTLASLLPLWILSLRYGVAWGAFAGGIYGTLQVLFGATMVTPVQALLDYPLAYASQGFLGWGRGVGLLAAFLGRLVCHSLAAPVFLGETLSIWVRDPRTGAILAGTGLAYNLPPLVLEFLVALALGAVLEQKHGRFQALFPEKTSQKPSDP